MLKLPDEILIFSKWEEFKRLKLEINQTKELFFQTNNFLQFTDQSLFGELSCSRDKCIQICIQRRYLLKLKHLKMDIISLIKNNIMELQEEIYIMNGIIEMIEVCVYVFLYSNI